MLYFEYRMTHKEGAQMRDSGWFDVEVFMTVAEWNINIPSYVFRQFSLLDNAINEADLWPEAFEVVVVARGTHNEFGMNVPVYMLKSDEMADIECLAGAC
jgi:hypothetical protein